MGNLYFCKYKLVKITTYDLILEKLSLLIVVINSKEEILLYPSTF